MREGPIYIEGKDEEIYPYTRIENPIKPSWDDAPVWAKSLAICEMDCYYYMESGVGAQENNHLCSVV
jgi:hypothetical protein